MNPEHVNLMLNQDFNCMNSVAIIFLKWLKNIQILKIVSHCQNIL